MFRTHWLSVVAAVLLAAVGVGRGSAADYAEHFAINIGAPVWYGQTTFTEQVAQDCAELGVRWIRVEFIASGDTIPYAAYDQLVNRANAYGIQILGLLTYQTKAWNSDSSLWNDDTWQDSFRDRCVEIVEHYHDSPGGPIAFWEVWNEPDSLGSMTAVKFARMLSIVYPAIKAVDPAATVVSGGLTSYWSAPYTYMQTVYNSTYFQDYNATYGNYPFDIFALHPYAWTSDPSSYIVNGMNGTYGMRRLLNNYGDSYKRIWFTEFGWNSSPTASSSINPGGDETYNEWLQAEYCDHAFTVDQALTYTTSPYEDFGPYVEKTFLFCYKDFDLGTPETREMFGTVRMDYARKPMFYRLKARGQQAWENLALTATVTASGDAGADYVPQRACDGTCVTKWAALSPADNEALTLDLGEVCEVHEFRVSHAEMGGEPDTYNTKAFVLQSRETGGAPWTTLASVTNTDREPVNVVTLAAPVFTRFVRLQITDAGFADGTARIPEFEVWGRPFAQANLATDAEFAADVAGLSVSVASNDLLAGLPATMESGDVDLDHDVYAYEVEAADCLDVRWDLPVTTFWDGYADPSPAAHVADLTDGSGATGVILNDFAWAAAVLRYDLPVPTDLHSVQVCAANAAADGRVFQNYDVYVSRDAGLSYEPVALGVMAGTPGMTNSGAYGASRTEVAAPLTHTLAEDVTNLRFVFYCTSNGGTFLDAWQGSGRESATYRTNCPSVDPQDLDGLRRAFVAPIIVEIDAFAHAFGDSDGDLDVDLGDFEALLEHYSGPDNAGTDCRYVDAPPRDGDVDLADVAAFQRVFGQ